MKKRIAAEWEPAKGVMIAYPISLPRSLVCELAKDTQIYLLCPDDTDEINKAKDLMTKFGIDAKTVKYLRVPKGDDATWPRDWGPHPLFTEKGEYKFLGPSYVLSTPFCGPEHDAPLTCAPWLDEPKPIDEFEGDTSDDLTAAAIAEQLDIDFIKLPFAFTGGNVLSDGIDSILSTEVLLLENRFKGFSEREFFGDVALISGMNNYSIFSDYEDYSLQHVDTLLKMLDAHRLLVLRPPEDHPLFQRYEDIVNNEISHALNSYGRPWEVLRMDTGVLSDGEGMASYVNSLILNKCIYVPMYGIPEDERALQQWEAAMPGYNIKGFEFVLAEEPDAFNPDDLYSEIGWDPGDVLHCRTRAVWDSEMLFMHSGLIDKVVNPEEEYICHVKIKDYSKSGLINDELKVFYRKAGMSNWESSNLIALSTRETYRAEIPVGDPGDTIEYYFAAADHSGRRATLPPTAPEGFYKFAIK